MTILPACVPDNTASVRRLSAAANRQAETRMDTEEPEYTTDVTYLQIKKPRSIAGYMLCLSTGEI